ncbi:MAG TPA: leucyl aminopeptidase [Actinomycetota bacterium]|nr:leucyl aminopeptidase [Actinomycetota bacterium]
MPPQLIPSEERATEMSGDALVVAAFAADDGPALAGAGSDLDAALDGRLSEHLRAISFKARVGDVTLVPTLGRLRAQTIAVAGLGPRDSAGPTEVRRAAGAAARALCERATVVCALHDSVDGSAAAAAEGLALGAYRFAGYKSKPRAGRLERALLPGARVDDTERAAALADATILARDLTNEPASTMTPDALAARAREVAHAHRLECAVADERELAERGFGGIVAVGKGSAQPPRLIELRHRPDGARGRVVLVGKGVTFDSGGLTLKQGASMTTMKTDMAGAAAVIGAMSALPRLGVALDVTAIVPAVENMPDGGAVRPGDVVHHYGGRTSEVISTDAEGRLILGDALAYACEMEPDAVVDVATLTGAISIALGPRAGGLFSNDDALSAELRDAGERAGQLLWPMPTIDAYLRDGESEVADLRNSATSGGGAIYAALFLRSFVPRGVPWAHLDVAGMARAERDYDEVSKGATGIPARALLTWIERRQA